MASDGKAGGDTAGNETFLGRWSRRKRVEPALREVEDAKVAAAAAEARAAEALVETKADAAAAAGPGQAKEPPADLPAIESLTPESDYTRFMQPDVPRASRNAAMKKLFTDPHFNVMDGLDTYIADYSIEDPIPESMLRELAQSKMLGLFDEKKDEEPVATDSAAENAGESTAARGDGTATPAPDAIAASGSDSVPVPTTIVKSDSIAIAAEPNPSMLLNIHASIQSPAAQPYNPPASKPLI